MNLTPDQIVAIILAVAAIGIPCLIGIRGLVRHGR